MGVLCYPIPRVERDKRGLVVALRIILMLPEFFNFVGSQNRE